MEKQLSRQEMFEKIQNLQRELADGAWDYVNVSHKLSTLQSKLEAYDEFIFSGNLDIAIGMSIGPDNSKFLADRVALQIRKEFKKINEQFANKQ